MPPEKAAMKPEPPIAAAMPYARAAPASGAICSQAGRRSRAPARIDGDRGGGPARATPATTP